MPITLGETNGGVPQASDDAQQCVLAQRQKKASGEALPGTAAKGHADGRGSETAIFGLHRRAETGRQGGLDFG